MSRLSIPTSPRRPAPPHWPGGLVPCAKLTAIDRWVARRLGGTDHERRVAAIASTLFDLTAPLHDLGPADRRLLQLGALAHDVGRAIDPAEHPTEGARMVASDGSLPLSPAERRGVAYLTRYHRGTAPAPAKDKVLAGADDVQRMYQLLALLRAADALDSRRDLEAPRLVFALLGSESRSSTPRLHVTCYLANDCAKARKVYRRRKKFRMLEEVFDLRIEVEIALAHALRMVA